MSKLCVAQKFALSRQMVQKLPTSMHKSRGRHKLESGHHHCYPEVPHAWCLAHTTTGLAPQKNSVKNGHQAASTTVEKAVDLSMELFRRVYHRRVPQDRNLQAVLESDKKRGTQRGNDRNHENRDSREAALKYQAETDK